MLHNLCGSRNSSRKLRGQNSLTWNLVDYWNQFEDQRLTCFCQGTSMWIIFFLKQKIACIKTQNSNWVCFCELPVCGFRRWLDLASSLLRPDDLPACWMRTVFLDHLSRLSGLELLSSLNSGTSSISLASDWSGLVFVLGLVSGFISFTVCSVTASVWAVVLSHCVLAVWLVSGSKGCSVVAWAGVMDTSEVETAWLKVSGGAAGLGVGKASTSETESSVTWTKSDGVIAVVRSSEIMGDCRELSANSPGQEPGVPVLGGSSPLSWTLPWSRTLDEFLENRWWAEKDLGSIFLCLEDLLLLTSSRNPESSPSFVPELMQLVNTLRLADAFSRFSVWDRGIFFLCPPNPNECRVFEMQLSRKASESWLRLSRLSWVGSLFLLLWKLSDGVRNRLRRLLVLLELEFVLEGEEVCTPLPTPPEEGEEGSESCLFRTLRLKIGSLETRVERRVPDSPMKIEHQIRHSADKKEKGTQSALAWCLE